MAVYAFLNAVLSSLSQKKNVYQVLISSFSLPVSVLRTVTLAVIMAVPPSYGDLGKAAKDLVNKGYNYGGTDFIL